MRHNGARWAVFRKVFIFHETNNLARAPVQRVSNEFAAVTRFGSPMHKINWRLQQSRIETTTCSHTLFTLLARGNKKSRKYKNCRNYCLIAKCFSSVPRESHRDKALCACDFTIKMKTFAPALNVSNSRRQDIRSTKDRFYNLYRNCDHLSHVRWDCSYVKDTRITEGAGYKFYAVVPEAIGAHTTLYMHKPSTSAILKRAS